jgi:hypothetical protein
MPPKQEQNLTCRRPTLKGGKRIIAVDTQGYLLYLKLTSMDWIVIDRNAVIRPIMSNLNSHTTSWNPSARSRWTVHHTLNYLLSNNYCLTIYFHGL